MLDSTTEQFAGSTYISKRKPFKVMVCTITLVAFLFSIVSQDIAWASESGSATIKELHVNTFDLPAYLGHVNDSWQSPNHPTIIHIQDAHCNYFAQSKIAEIVEYLNKRYGIDTINLEGGAKDYDLSVFTDIQDKSLRRKASEHFVKEGLVNGAEYFAVNNPDKVRLWGIEDTKLYVDNLNVYKDSLKHKAEIDKHLKALSYILSNLKLHIYSKTLLELDMKYSQYKAGSIDFKEYLSYLIRLTAERGIEAGGFKNILVMDGILKAEGEIDFKKANNERDSLVEMLENRLSRDLTKELLARSIEFKSERISQKEFYAYVLAKAKFLNIPLNNFSEFRKYVNYVSTYETIDKSKIMDEVEALDLKIREGLYQDDKERQLYQLSKNLALLKNIFNISITKNDYRYYLANKESFDVSSFVSFIHSSSGRLNVRYSVDNLDSGIANLDQYREDMAKFYEYSLKRDEAFVKNIKFKKSAILITGGFHTENLAELFRKNGISYISITPNFKNPNGYESPYFRILSGQKSLDIKMAMPAVLGMALAIPDALCPAMRDIGTEIVSVVPTAQSVAPVNERPETVQPTYKKWSTGMWLGMAVSTVFLSGAVVGLGWSSSPIIYFPLYVGLANILSQLADMPKDRAAGVGAVLRKFDFVRLVVVSVAIGGLMSQMLPVVYGRALMLPGFDKDGYSTFEKVVGVFARPIMDQTHSAVPLFFAIPLIHEIYGNLKANGLNWTLSDASRNTVSKAYGKRGSILFSWLIAGPFVVGLMNIPMPDWIRNLIVGLLQPPILAMVDYASNKIMGGSEQADSSRETIIKPWAKWAPLVLVPVIIANYIFVSMWPILIAAPVIVYWVVKGFEIVPASRVLNTNVTCGTICEAGHQEVLDKELEKYYEDLAKIAVSMGRKELNRDIKDEELSEEEVIDALDVTDQLHILGTTGAKLKAIINSVRTQLNIPKGVAILPAVPPHDKMLWWVTEPETGAHLYAGGHFNGKGTRIHISLPLILNQKITGYAAKDAALKIVKHDYAHIEAIREDHPERGHTDDEGVALVTKVAELESPVPLFGNSKRESPFDSVIKKGSIITFGDDATEYELMQQWQLTHPLKLPTTIKIRRKGVTEKGEEEEQIVNGATLKFLKVAEPGREGSRITLAVYLMHGRTEIANSTEACIDILNRHDIIGPLGVPLSDADVDDGTGLLTSIELDGNGGHVVYNKERYELKQNPDGSYKSSLMADVKSDEKGYAKAGLCEALSSKRRNRLANILSVNDIRCGGSRLAPPDIDRLGIRQISFEKPELKKAEIKEGSIKLSDGTILYFVRSLDRYEIVSHSIMSDGSVKPIKDRGSLAERLPSLMSELRRIVEEKRFYWLGTTRVAPTDIDRYGVTNILFEGDKGQFQCRNNTLIHFVKGNGPDGKLRYVITSHYPVNGKLISEHDYTLPGQMPVSRAETSAVTEARTQAQDADEAPTLVIGAKLGRSLPSYTDRVIEALEECGGNREDTARKLNISSRALAHRIKVIREKATERNKTEVVDRLDKAAGGPLFDEITQMPEYTDETLVALIKWHGNMAYAASEVGIHKNSMIVRIEVMRDRAALLGRTNIIRTLDRLKKGDRVQKRNFVIPSWANDVVSALDKNNGNITLAARVIGVKRSALANRIKIIRKVASILDTVLLFRLDKAMLKKDAVEVSRGLSPKVDAIDRAAKTALSSGMSDDFEKVRPRVRDMTGYLEKIDNKIIRDTLMDRLAKKSELIHSLNVIYNIGSLSVDKREEKYLDAISRIRKVAAELARLAALDGTQIKRRIAYIELVKPGRDVVRLPILGLSFPDSLHTVSTKFWQRIPVVGNALAYRFGILHESLHKLANGWKGHIVITRDGGKINRMEYSANGYSTKHPIFVTLAAPLGSIAVTAILYSGSICSMLIAGTGYDTIIYILAAATPLFALPAVDGLVNLFSKDELSDGKIAWDLIKGYRRLNYIDPTRQGKHLIGIDIGSDKRWRLSASFNSNMSVVFDTPAFWAFLGQYGITHTASDKISNDGKSHLLSIDVVGHPKTIGYGDKFNENIITAKLNRYMMIGWISKTVDAAIEGNASPESVLAVFDMSLRKDMPQSDRIICLNKLKKLLKAMSEPNFKHGYPILEELRHMVGTKEFRAYLGEMKARGVRVLGYDEPTDRNERLLLHKIRRMIFDMYMARFNGDGAAIVLLNIDDPRCKELNEWMRIQPLKPEDDDLVGMVYWARAYSLMADHMFSTHAISDDLTPKFGWAHNQRDIYANRAKKAKDIPSLTGAIETLVKNRDAWISGFKNHGRTSYDAQIEELRDILAVIGGTTAERSYNGPQDGFDYDQTIAAGLELKETSAMVDEIIPAEDKELRDTPRAKELRQIVRDRGNRIVQAYETEIVTALTILNVKSNEIDNVISALRDPFGPDRLKWFNSRIVRAEKYFLGHKTGLAIDLVEFLLGAENDSNEERDLLDEYILHEILEGVDFPGVKDGKAKHGLIIGITSDIFGRLLPRGTENKDTPLGSNLRVFINLKHLVNMAVNEGNEKAIKKLEEFVTDPGLADKDSARALIIEGLVDAAPYKEKAVSEALKRLEPVFERIIRGIHSQYLKDAAKKALKLGVYYGDGKASEFLKRLPGVDAGSSKLFTRLEHEKVNENGRFFETIRTIMVELKESAAVQNVTIDDSAKMDNIGNLKFNVRHAMSQMLRANSGRAPLVNFSLQSHLTGTELRVEEDGILVIVDDRFWSSHAGRDEWAVYARNEWEAQHELTELRAWKRFAEENGIIEAKSNMLTCRLGKKMRRWINDTVDTTELLRRRRLVSDSAARFHLDGMRAQFKYWVEHNKYGQDVKRALSDSERTVDDILKKYDPELNLFIVDKPFTGSEYDLPLFGGIMFVTMHQSTEIKNNSGVRFLYEAGLRRIAYPFIPDNSYEFNNSEIPARVLYVYAGAWLDTYTNSNNTEEQLITSADVVIARCRQAIRAFNKELFPIDKLDLALELTREVMLGKSKVQLKNFVWLLRMGPSLDGILAMLDNDGDRRRARGISVNSGADREYLFRLISWNAGKRHEEVMAFSPVSLFPSDHEVDIVISSSGGIDLLDKPFDLTIKEGTIIKFDGDDTKYKLQHEWKLTYEPTEIKIKRCREDGSDEEMAEVETQRVDKNTRKFLLLLDPRNGDSRISAAVYLTHGHTEHATSPEALGRMLQRYDIKGPVGSILKAADLDPDAAFIALTELRIEGDKGYIKYGDKRYGLIQNPDGSYESEPMAFNNAPKEVRRPPVLPVKSAIVPAVPKNEEIRKIDNGVSKNDLEMLKWAESVDFIGALERNKKWEGYKGGHEYAAQLLQIHVKTLRRIAGELKRIYSARGDKVALKRLNAAFAKPTKKGAIAGDEVNGSDMAEYLKKMDEESKKITAKGLDVADVIDVRCERLLSRADDIRKMLNANHVEKGEVENEVMEALKNPDENFKLFQAKVTRAEKFFLGHSTGLAMDLIRFLAQEEKETGVNDLVDEYILHETLEKIESFPGTEGILKGKHHKIIEITNEFFGRPSYTKPIDTALGRALRKFIRLRIELQEHPVPISLLDAAAAESAMMRAVDGEPVVPVSSPIPAESQIPKQDASQVFDEQPLYKEATGIVSSITGVAQRGVHTFITGPTLLDEAGLVGGCDPEAHRVFQKMGHDNVKVEHYIVKDSANDTYVNLAFRVERTLMEFNAVVKSDANTRWMIRATSTDAKENILKYVENGLIAENTDPSTGKVNKEAVKNALSKVKVIVVDIENVKSLNPVIDLFVDFGILELDRYGKPDGYRGEAPEKLRESVERLLKLSISNFDDIPGATLAEKLINIFNGVALKINAVNWKSIDQKRRSWNALLQAA